MKTSPILALVVLFLLVTQARAEDLLNVDPVLRAQASAIVTPLACSDAPLLSCGSTRIGSLGSCLSGQYFIDLYSFNATSGQTITLQATTTSSNQILASILDSGGTILSSNFGPFVASVTYTFTSSGTYFFGIAFVAQFATGPYTAGVTCANSQTSSCMDSGTLALKGIIGGQLTAANGNACLGGGTNYYSARYAFHGIQDTPVKISVSANFGPYVEVQGTDNAGGVFVQNALPATVNVSYLPAYTGTHYIFISSYGTKSTGTYTVALDAIPVDPCRRRVVSH